MAELTKAEKILVAASRLDSRGRAEFTTEDITVEAFKAFPNDFCIKGYPEYPDNNSVLTLLMGKDARLVVTGWLEKTGTKKYRVTAKGLHDAASLDSELAGSAETTTALRTDRKMEEALGRLFDSAAFAMFRDGEAEKITFHQFCRFVGLAAPDTWQKIQGKLEETRHLVEEARKLGESGQSLRLHFRGVNHTYAPDDLMLLRAVFDTLSAKFRSEMDAWKRKSHMAR